VTIVVERRKRWHQCLNRMLIKNMTKKKDLNLSNNQTLRVNIIVCFIVRVKDHKLREKCLPLYQICIEPSMNKSSTTLLTGQKMEAITLSYTPWINSNRSFFQSTLLQLLIPHLSDKYVHCSL
jgi:hypothetical protein